MSIWEDYKDIISLPHHVSKKHPGMPVCDRAAQFAPFAALTGYGAVLKETERVTKERLELDEYEKEKLDEKLKVIMKEKGHSGNVTVTFFKRDEKKNGGSYQKISGHIKKLDVIEHVLIFEEGDRIPLEDVIDLTENSAETSYETKEKCLLNGEDS